MSARTLGVVTSAPGELPALVARSVEIADPGALLERLGDPDAFVWLRDGEGLVGWGRAAECRPSGEDRFLDASDWWREVVARSEVFDEVRVPGTGMVCFAGFTFSGERGDSVLAIPRVVVGRRNGISWATVISRADEPVEETDLTAVHAAPRPPEALVLSGGALADEDWKAVVADAVARIVAGDLEKVVLARDLVATAQAPIDVRWPLRRLARDYRRCWTFHVDGWFGATPEMLVRRERGLVTSRVLAGTIRRTGDDQHDLALAGTLARSSKDLEEHEYAVRSVADALAPYCDSMNLPDAPFVLHLPNVMHLATDVTAVVHGERTGANALELAAALHPSAAVGGTPTKAAVRLISEVEGMDRGRYAAPVGWMDGAGDGEFGIALRSAHLDGATVRLFAGCGIVADSDPESELAESEAKLIPVRDALQPE